MSAMASAVPGMYAFPSVPGTEVLVGKKDGKRTLTIRDRQDEYIYTEVRR
jgi:hypothetical protein